MQKTRRKSMSERGLSSILGIGVTIVVLLISASIYVSSIRSYQNETRAAETKRDERIVNKTQSDIKIENSWYNSSQDNLKILSTNSGSTVLKTSSVQIFMDGKMIPSENISSKRVENIETDIWAPREDLEIKIENYGRDPQKIKLISDYGISDYFTKIGG